MGGRQRVRQLVEGLATTGRQAEPSVFPTYKGPPALASREDLLGGSKRRFLERSEKPSGRDEQGREEARGQFSESCLDGPFLSD